MACAIIGASLVPALIIPGALFLSDRGGLLSDPLVLIIASVGIGLPLGLISVVAVFVPDSRYLARRGHSHAGPAMAIGAIVGVLVIAAVWVLMLDPGPASPGSSAPFLLSIGALSGAATAGVYWWLLNPPSYYRKP